MPGATIQSVCAFIYCCSQESNFLNFQLIQLRFCTVTAATLFSQISLSHFNVWVNVEWLFDWMVFRHFRVIITATNVFPLSMCIGYRSLALCWSYTEPLCHSTYLWLMWSGLSWEAEFNIVFQLNWDRRMSIRLFLTYMDQKKGPAGFSSLLLPTLL